MRLFPPNVGVRVPLTPTYADYAKIPFSFKLTSANPITIDYLLESWMVEGDDANVWHDDTLPIGETLDTIQLIGYAGICHGMDSYIVGSS